MQKKCLHSENLYLRKIAYLARMPVFQTVLECMDALTLELTGSMLKMDS